MPEGREHTMHQMILCVLSATHRSEMNIKSEVRSRSPESVFHVVFARCNAMNQRGSGSHYIIPSRTEPHTRSTSLPISYLSRFVSFPGQIRMETCAQTLKVKIWANRGGMEPKKDFKKLAASHNARVKW